MGASHSSANCDAVVRRYHVFDVQVNVGAGERLPTQLRHRPLWLSTLEHEMVVADISREEIRHGIRVSARNDVREEPPDERRVFP